MTEQHATSVEAPLWRALAGYRLLTAGYAVSLFAFNHTAYDRAPIGAAYLAALALWTLGSLRQVSSSARCTPRFLAGDMAFALSGILLTPVVDPQNAVSPTLPSIWVAGPVLAVAVKAGWRWAAAASVVVGIANLAASGGFERSTVHNVLLVCVAAVGIGYVVEVARASERALARALRIEAATRERERLARDIHDGVLQVLAMVQRRAGALGGEAAELGRLAGEQEIALRRLVSGAALPAQRRTDAQDGAGRDAGTAPVGADDDGRRSGGGGDIAVPAPGAGAVPRSTGGAPGRAAPSRAVGTGPGVIGQDPAEGPLDVRALLAAHADDRVTFSGPAGPVELPALPARNLTDAVAAALDNVRHHAAGPDGVPGAAWILLEDEPESVLVTVRDEGPGIPAGRLAEAEAEGRLGVSLSIRGRMREVGGSAEWLSVPGQGTEVELRVPRR